MKEQRKVRKPRRQCKLCPWRKDVDPRDIPNGYCEKKHAALERTIASGVESLTQRAMMACHETKVGKEPPCVGWLMNQLGPGNNIGLRLAVLSGAVDADVELVGEQYERFEDTLPKKPVIGYFDPEERGRQNRMSKRGVR